VPDHQRPAAAGWQRPACTRRPGQHTLWALMAHLLKPLDRDHSSTGYVLFRDHSNVACPRPPLPPCSSLVLSKPSSHNTMVLPRLLGCASFCMSFMPHFTAPHWCIVTRSMQSTCPPIQSNISAPSTSRLIFNSFESELLLVIFAWF